MKRSQLVELLAAARGIVGERDLVIIGSQCVHARTDDAPAEVLMSRECDVLLDEHDALTARLDAELGEASAYRAEHGVYVDTVNDDTFPFLPSGWEQRTQPLVDGVRCLEVHDLVLSKLAAGRLKDYELVAVLLGRALADETTVRDRIAMVTELRMRAILLARLQIVLESAGR
jgi:hypothetical protein